MIRKFLLLQGPVGPFFGILSRHLRNAGHEVVKVNFNGGDDFFYARENLTGTTIDYEDGLDKWQEFVKNLAKSSGVTDLVVYGDCRPIHKTAIETLRTFGIRIHVLEEGYFRPNWVTYERDGVNYYSSLPRDAEFYRNYEAPKLPETRQVKSSFGRLVWFVMQYYFSHLYYSNTGRFKNFRLHFADGNHHKAFWPWVPKLLQKPFLKIEAAILQRKALASKFYLVPLQLSRDFQITEHSNFKDMKDFIKYVVNAFAAEAPQDVKLVIKNHPLDPAFNELRNTTKEAAQRNRLADRVIFIEGGHLPTLLEASLGVITVNSTAGLQAIHHNTPTLVLGRSFYSIDGLVNKVSIADFLNNPQKPDMELYKKFRNYVMLKTQVGGSYYEKLGMELAAEQIIEKLGKS